MVVGVGHGEPDEVRRARRLLQLLAFLIQRVPVVHDHRLVVLHRVRQHSPLLGSLEPRGDAVGSRDLLARSKLGEDVVAPHRRAAVRCDVPVHRAEDAPERTAPGDVRRRSAHPTEPERLSEWKGDLDDESSFLFLRSTRNQ